MVGWVGWFTFGVQTAEAGGACNQHVCVRATGVFVRVDLI